MGNLLDAYKVEARLDTLRSIWNDNDDLLFVLDDVSYWIRKGFFAFEDYENTQPEPSRQTLVEALEGAEVGTRFRHKGSSLTGWVVVVAPGYTYSHNDGTDPGPIANEYPYNGGVRYADEFIIEYPTY